MDRSKAIKGYQLLNSNKLEDVTWVMNQDLWVTHHGLLTDGGFSDHYGRDALVSARQMGRKYDHLRFDLSAKELTIIDGLGREGLNLAYHPFMLDCFLKTMWRFSGAVGHETFNDQNDLHAFYGWVEKMAENVSNRDGKAYSRPSNMFADAVHLDH